MSSRRSLVIGVISIALAMALGVAHPGPVRALASQARGAVRAPSFQVDPLWPKPLPNHWILGSVTGVAVDGQDHVWLVHRGLDSLTARTEAGTGTTPPTAEDCCAPAPPVLEFDASGALLGHWGGPGQGYDWPVSPGGIAVDAQGNIWIAAAGPPEPPTASRITVPIMAPRGGQGAGGGQAGGRRGGGRGGAAAPARPEDAHVLKFSSAGQFLLQIGKAGEAGAKDSTTNLDRPAAVAVDSAANELYVADGGAHQRVVVFDAASGAFKRQWGGHGSEFARLSCVAVSKDGLVYVCDRKNDRLQVFRRDGTFVKETIVSKSTAGNGSVWGVAFSSDPQQRFLYVADGQDEKVFVLQRDSLAELASFGDGGRQPGQFYAITALATDSNGNLYTAETYEGKRVQKFLKRN